MTWRIALDRGGTFTDIVAERADGHVVVAKVPTDDGAAPDRPRSVVAAIRRITGAPAVGVITRDHVVSVRAGSTSATNALLERRGEPCALLVTRGFADILRIGAQTRPDLFALDVRRPEPLCATTIEIDERVLADGSVRTPLDRAAVSAAAARLASDGIRSAAVLFLHAFAFPAHEAEATQILRAAGIPYVVASHEVANEIGAVARGETTAADAYLTPVLRRSLATLRGSFAPDVDVRFMQSHGGLADAAHARGPAAVLSGPAGGALAVARTIALAGEQAGIGFDMGGTSTDVCRVGPGPETAYETRAAGFRLRVPTLRVHTVAAGGGSILAFDGRRFTVGPESAGASPGPAGYGLGGPPTVTDADAVLGRLVVDAFPACFGPDGTRPFDIEASRRAIEPLAAAAGLSVEETAAGFVRIADERVAQAVREESLLRGHDVRTHALVAFGGAGPQHACAVAAALGSPSVLVTRRSSVLSAWGIAGARPAHEEVRALLAGLDDEGLAAAVGVSTTLRGTAEEALRRQSAVASDVAATLELRVAGVDATIAVPLRSLDATRAAFEAAHRRLYGFAPQSGAAIEIVNVRVRAEAAAPHEHRAADSTTRHGTGTQSRRDVAVWFAAEDGRLSQVRTQVVPLATLAPGDALVGPGLVVDDVTTVVVEPGWRLVAEGPELLRLSPPTARRSSGDARPAAARDPVSLALFANAFMSAAERMGSVLERVSHSTNIKERLDFSCAVFDGEGRLVANAPHVPVHLGAMGESVRAIAAARGLDLREGDAILTNDPYRGGSHLPDVTVVTPVLVEGGRPRFFVANRAHHADVGGVSPGSMPPLSTSIADEGVRIHDLLVVRGGEFREADVRAAFAAGPHPARGPDERIADLRAQAAANAEGARLLLEMAAARGADVVAAWMAHVLDDGEAAMREVLAALPEGTTTREEMLDDGTPIRVAVTIRGGGATIDFAGTGPRGGTNLHAPRAVVRAAVLYAFRTLVRRGVPLNEGCLRPLRIEIPAGSLLDPAPPDAVVGGNVETSQRVVDLVLGAVGACAASQGTMNNLTFGTSTGVAGGPGGTKCSPGMATAPGGTKCPPGIATAPGGTKCSPAESRAYYETLGGGMGAGPGHRGASAVQCHMTNTRITDVEVLERRFPVVVRTFGVRRGSGGAGMHRGGDGLVREIEFLAPAQGGILSERRTRGAPGLGGGGDGLPGRNLLIRDGVAIVLPSRAAIDVRPGDVLRIETPGGGGWGPAGP